MSQNNQANIGNKDARQAAANGGTTGTQVSGTTSQTPPRTPAGSDDKPAGTRGPTPSDEGKRFADRSSPAGPIKGGEAEKPDQMQGDEDKSPKD